MNGSTKTGLWRPIHLVGRHHGACDALGVVWAFVGGYAVYGTIKATLGLRLSQNEEFEGADLSIHKIGATPDRETNW